MALNAVQKQLLEELVRQYVKDQQDVGNLSPLTTIAFATTPQVKAATLSYVTAAKAKVQTSIDGAAAARALEDAAWAQLIVNYDAIITEFG